MRHYYDMGAGYGYSGNYQTDRENEEPRSFSSNGFDDSHEDYDFSNDIDFDIDYDIDIEDFSFFTNPEEIHLGFESLDEANDYSDSNSNFDFGPIASTIDFLDSPVAIGVSSSIKFRIFNVKFSFSSDMINGGSNFAIDDIISTAQAIKSLTPKFIDFDSKISGFDIGKTINQEGIKIDAMAQASAEMLMVFGLTGITVFEGEVSISGSIGSNGEIDFSIGGSVYSFGIEVTVDYQINYIHSWGETTSESDDYQLQRF